MKGAVVLVAACLSLFWINPGWGNDPPAEGLHLQLEPLYLKVWGARENLADLVNHQTSLTVDPTNDFTLRGEISYRKGNWRLGLNGWWFDSDYELVKTVPPANFLGHTKVSFWSLGPFVDYKIYGSEGKELFLQWGAKFCGSQQRLMGVCNSEALVSHSEVNFHGGPGIGLKGQINFLKNFWLKGFITQSVTIGEVSRKVIRRQNVMEFAPYTVFIPITEAQLKVSYHFTPRFASGVGGFLSVWYEVPSPARPWGTNQWREPEDNLVFAGLILAAEGKW
uniref:Outer membrane protein beta-barrel domain-containing protein n=1 Tax=Desulfobacca acetoxidans TaxID=60893 RepID=A0A7C5EU76_9BACT